MADIPNIPQVGELRAPTRTGTQQNPLTPELANTGGALAARAASASSAIAAAFSRIQQEQDEINVLDAENKLREEAVKLSRDPEKGFLSITGEAVARRPDGKALSQTYIEQFDAAAERVSANLTSARQREMFEQRLAVLRTAFVGDVSAHELRELRAHSQSVQMAAAEAAQNELVALGATKGVTVASIRERAKDAAKRVKDAVLKAASYTSLSEEEAKQRAQQAVSRAHKLAVMAAIDRSDVSFAREYFDTFKEDMTGEDLLQVRKALTELETQDLANTVAMEVSLGVLPPAEPMQAAARASFDDIMQILFKLENAPGDPRARSHAGAIGVGQMLPTTGPEAARLAGVEWNKARFYNDPDYQRVLSSAYFAEMLRRWNGDVELAIGSYHSGYTNVKNAVEASRRTGRPWTSFLGPEGQAHMRKFGREMARLAQRRTGQTRTAGRAATTRQEVLLRIASDPRLANNPEARRQAESIALRNLELRERDLRQAQEDAFAQGLNAVLAGQDPRTLPLSLRQRMGPANEYQLRNMYDAEARREQTNDPATLLELLTPGKLASMTNQEFLLTRPKLRAETWEMLARSRAAAIAGGVNQKDPTAVDLSMLSEVLRPRMPSLRDALDAPNNKEKQQKWEAEIRLAMTTAVRAEQIRLGRPLSQLEMEQVVDRLASTQYGYVNERPLLPDRRASKPLLAMTVSDIPRADRERLEEAWRQLNPDMPKGSRPDDDTLLRAWRHMQIMRTTQPAASKP